jgi:glyoxylase-like metal-dependent hydrolase (beta-lactamase superfamily II)
MYELTPISDGILKTPEHAVIGLDQKIIRSHLNIDENGETFIPVYAFLYRLDQHVILCDTGSGHDMQPTLGRVPQSLHAQGIKPDDITHILLTHMHADHANGLIDQHGAAIYPNATLYIMRDEYDFWMKDEISEFANVQRTRMRSRKNLAPYQGRIQLVKNHELILNCTALLSAGHSVGHTCWQINALHDSYLVWGDCVHFSQLQIRYHNTAVMYDYDKDKAREARIAMLEKAVKENLIIAGAHIAPSGLARITREGDHYTHKTL